MIVQSCTSIRQLSVQKPLLYFNKFLSLFCKRYPRPSLCRNVSSVHHERSDPCTAVYTIPHPPLSLPHHLYIYVILLRRLRDICTEYLRRTVNWFLKTIGLIPGMMGTVMPFRTATIHERIIFFIIEEHLGLPDIQRHFLLSPLSNRYQIPYWALPRASPDSKPCRTRRESLYRLSWNRLTRYLR